MKQKEFNKLLCSLKNCNQPAVVEVKSLVLTDSFDHLFCEDHWIRHIGFFSSQLSRKSDSTKKLIFLGIEDDLTNQANV